MVIVAGFSKYDMVSDRKLASRLKMRVDLIAAGDGLTKLEGTEENVPESELDADGRYNPNA